MFLFLAEASFKNNNKKNQLHRLDVWILKFAVCQMTKRGEVMRIKRLGRDVNYC